MAYFEHQLVFFQAQLTCLHSAEERVIGSIRGECLDPVVILGERPLKRILSSYADYYHRVRTHLALEKDAPCVRPTQTSREGRVVELKCVGGLHHEYARVAA